MRLAMRNRAFLFFSLIMPLAFLFGYAGLFGRVGPEAVPYLLADGAGADRDGQLLGPERAACDVSRAGDPAAFPRDSGRSQLHAGVEPALELLPDAADGGIEFYISRSLFHMASLGNVLSVFFW